MSIYFRPLKPIALSEIKEKCKEFSIKGTIEESRLDAEDYHDMCKELDL